MRVIYEERQADLLDDWSKWDEERLQTVQGQPDAQKLYVRVKFLPSGYVQQVPILKVQPAVLLT